MGSEMCIRDRREMARSIIGGDDLIEIYVKASFEACQERDVKGLYAKAKEGLVPNFTGKDSGFEEPSNPDLVIDTEQESIEESLQKVLTFLLPKVESR